MFANQCVSVIVCAYLDLRGMCLEEVNYLVPIVQTLISLGLDGAERSTNIYLL